MGVFTTLVLSVVCIAAIAGRNAEQDFIFKNALTNREHEIILNEDSPPSTAEATSTISSSSSKEATTSTLTTIDVTTPSTSTIDITPSTTETSSSSITPSTYETTPTNTPSTTGATPSTTIGPPSTTEVFPSSTELAISTTEGSTDTTLSTTNLSTGSTTISTTFSSSSTSYTTASPAPSNYCDSQYSCLNCTAARICAPTADGRRLREIDRFTCPAATPWCDDYTGTCSDTPSDSCGPTPEVSSTFICMRDGFFPDLGNCSQYYHCDQRVPYTYGCEGSYPFYSSSAQGCVNYTQNCANLTAPCDGVSGKKIAVYTFPKFNIFAYCIDGSPAAVDRCIGAYQFNESNQDCEAHCPHEGLFPRDDDCVNYYKCSLDPPSTGYTMTNYTCPSGQGFSEEAFQCVDRSLAPNCLVDEPGLFNKK